MAPPPTNEGAEFTPATNAPPPIVDNDNESTSSDSDVDFIDSENSSDASDDDGNSQNDHEHSDNEDTSDEVFFTSHNDANDENDKQTTKSVQHDIDNKGTALNQNEIDDNNLEDYVTSDNNDSSQSSSVSVKSSSDDDNDDADPQPSEHTDSLSQVIHDTTIPPTQRDSTAKYDFNSEVTTAIILEDNQNDRPSTLRYRMRRKVEPKSSIDFSCRYGFALTQMSA